MSLRIAPVSVDDPASIDAWVEVVERIREYEFPYLPARTRRMAELMFEHAFPARAVEHQLAWVDGEPAGRLEVSRMTEDNLKVLSFTIEVAPRFRRRGVGRALFGEVLAYAREHGRTVLVTGASLSMPGLPAPDEAPGAFAAALGFTNTLPELQRRLTLAEVDEDVLAGMLAAAQAKATGYRLVRWRDAAPEELAEGVAYLDSRLMSDAPTGDLQIEAEKPDVARMRRVEEVIAARGRRTFHTGAVDEQTGALVAWTTISNDDETPWHAWQQITIVDPDHRGHRLGALVKVENLRFFRAEMPQVEVVDTFNAAENGYMIAINEQMGFRKLAAFQNWQRDLAKDGSTATAE
ncbi:N-acetyltransferase [Catellatospora methionotrophica]|uniref:N-acetyltransferase n=1 Tax=Catellatospora methionotrophica TaxID=121620 RepID=A0A8J3LRM5_9ACTN|nr:GNAT family N-acetyltransferase [Catellatospora methionotrophica]GIG17640.1 N-acetyltransferase [Catellatospora methionotrophica]